MDATVSTSVDPQRAPQRELAEQPPKLTQRKNKQPWPSLSGLGASAPLRYFHLSENPLPEGAGFLVPVPFVAWAAHNVYKYIVETADPVIVFFGGSLVVFAAYYVFDYILTRCVPRYAAIGDQDKKFYVLSNLIKCVLLAAFSPYCVVLLRDTLVMNEWPSTRIRNLGALYAITDFTSLLVVRRMQWTTVLHHVCVVVFNAFSMRNDYSEENVFRLVMVYAVCSTFAYMVNLLLASRFLHVGEKAAYVLSNIALVVYGSACCMNWAWQLYYLRRLVMISNHWSIYFYVVLIGFVIYDDLILNRWLCHNAIKSSQKLMSSRIRPRVFC
eukprot:comp6994_c0_seq1/m.2729 comp6994_c0_seq1/g.2729  ORF comp6994_c0_seq1/g.2729 comp6994_c0_seq1/m.2729 type:complete len:327 (-) comp6994_c0_seq1:90-1070(-)